MDFSTIGSINSYTKTLKMQAQWNFKKKSGDVTSHTSSVDEWLKGTAAPQEESGGDEKLSSIRQKAYTGKKLTDDEKQYLQAKDPLTYQKLQANEQEQKAYEQALKKCRTKEDVQRLKLAHVGATLATVKSIENNPHISQEKKLQMISLENAKCDKMERSTQAFVKSGEYAQLPTEAEKARAEKELQEAEQAKRGTEVEQPKPEQSERDPEVEQPETEQSEMAAAQAAPHTEPVEKYTATPTDGEKRLPASGAKGEPSSSVEPDSPEIRKTRRAKAKAAYAAVRTFAADADMAALDIKA